ncbi:hypothetical protein EIMP300_84990 [Escherichia coli]|uniref:Uncharacterized protein n=1 Tax=Escherichia coli TaxID=562 RepID=A0A8S0G3I7_ECOLX|nr:hypothetical protein EIMP300_84990 [Escherichia coli]
MDRDQTNSSLFNDDPVLHATWLYYQEGKSQTEVAAIMGVSRVTVVKYLFKQPGKMDWFISTWM